VKPLLVVLASHMESESPFPMAQKAAQDREDFRRNVKRVFQTQYKRLVSLLARLTGDYGSAEDLAAEAFCKLISRSALFRPWGSLEGWMYRTALNLGLDAVRVKSNRRRKERTIAVEERITQRPQSSPLGDLLREEECFRVRTALAQLKPISARLLLLRYADFSYKELAETLSLSPASVGQMLFRATIEFREKYSKLERGAP
jgi:RNA polymerase sigma-70 factor, ECF subfamily